MFESFLLFKNCNKRLWDVDCSCCKIPLITSFRDIPTCNRKIYDQNKNYLVLDIEYYFTATRCMESLQSLTKPAPFAKPFCWFFDSWLSWIPPKKYQKIVVLYISVTIKYLVPVINIMVDDYAPWNNSRVKTKW